MTTAKIKRSEVKTFLNVAPSSTASYKLIGDGVTTATINMNPNVTNETYISEETASIYVESYAPTLPVEAVAKNGDDVFEFVDGLRKARSILEEAETDIVNVWLYETPSGSEYPAEKQPVSIQIDSFGGDGGVAARINYTINYIGDAIPGTFNPTTLTFTETSE
jgi:hypothetical protein